MSTIKNPRKVWEKVFGKIPEKFHIHHKDGNPTNNKIDNLECLSSSEHAKRHTGELWAASRKKDPSLGEDILLWMQKHNKRPVDLAALACVNEATIKRLIRGITQYPQPLTQGAIRRVLEEDKI